MDIVEYISHTPTQHVNSAYLRLMQKKTTFSQTQLHDPLVYSANNIAKDISNLMMELVKKSHEGEPVH